jgi:hypothetical protein
MIAASFTGLPGCAVPIQMAGMGGCNPELIAAQGVEALLR